MAIKYYSDGTYTKGDGKLYVSGIGVVGKVGSTNASRNETGITKPSTTTTTTTTTTTRPSSSSSSSTKKQNQDRYNAATSGSQSIEDYLGSYGVDPNVRYDTVKDKYKGTANENKYTYVEDKYPTTSYAKQQKDKVDQYLAERGINVPQQTPEEMVEEELENPYEEAMKRYEEQQAYIKEQQRLANQAAVNSGVERLQNQLKTSNQGFDEAGRQAYIRATQAEYALPNQLAAMGYTGGLSETEAARGRANYQNQMADIEQQRVNAQNEVYAAINNLKNTADQRTAEQNIALAKEYADRLLELQIQADQYGEQQKTKDLERWAGMAKYAYEDDYTQAINDLIANNQNDPYLSEKIAYLNQLRTEKLAKREKDEQEQEEIDRKLAQQEWDNQYKQAGLLADIGDFSGLKALGIDTTNLQKQWNADYNKTIASTKSSSGTPKANQTYQQVLNAIQDMTPSGGSDYQENVSAAKYLLNSDMSAENILSIMKQVNVRPEAMVREMMSEGYSLEDISAFVDAYTPNQAYRDSIMQYAQK